MNEFTSIIMGNNEPLERKGKLFIYGIEERFKESLAFIKNEYERYENFQKTIDYVEYLHSDTVKADFHTLQRVGYYPSTEIEMELDHSIKHALIGSYKAAFSDLRRALELSIIFIYLVLEETDEKKAVNWIKSNYNTVAFSKALKILIKHGRYQEINSSCHWMKRLQELYIELSGISHNKGILKGYRELNNVNFFTAGTSAPSIKTETLKSFCDFYIQTVQEIIAIQVLYNPIIIVGVPFDEKFGLDGPMSGFMNDIQSEKIKELIPEKYQDFFNHLIENDTEIKGTIEYFESLPDLTEEDIKDQVKRHEEFLGQSEKNNPSP